MSSLRASSLPLLTKCTGSLVIPCNYEKTKEAQEAADWGTMVHYWAQTGEIRHDDKRTANAFRKAVEISEIDRLAFWPTGGVHEGPLALSVDGSGQASRDDTERDGWITGHYDFQWWLFEDELWIDDIKTNKFYPNPEPGQIGHIWGLEVGANRFPPRPSSEQMKFYSLAVAELLEYRGPVNVSVTHWPRLPLWRRHTLPERLWWRYMHSELMMFWNELEFMYDTHEINESVIKSGGVLSLCPGSWCKFCPAKNNCLMAQMEAT